MEPSATAKLPSVPKVGKKKFPYTAGGEKAAEMEAKKMAGALVDRETVLRASYESSRLLRDMMLSVPSKSAGELAAITSPQEVEVYLRRALQRILSELSRLTRTGLEPVEN